MSPLSNFAPSLRPNCEMQFAPDATLLPVLLVLSALPLYASYKLITHLRSKRDAAAKLASTGIGRGAPGFLTGSKRVGIPRAFLFLRALC